MNIQLIQLWQINEHSLHVHGEYQLQKQEVGYIDLIDPHYVHTKQIKLDFSHS